MQINLSQKYSFQMACMYFTDEITPSPATKNASESVVCWSRLLHIFAYAKDQFRHTDKYRLAPVSNVICFVLKLIISLRKLFINFAWE